MFNFGFEIPQINLLYRQMTPPTKNSCTPPPYNQEVHTAWSSCKNTVLCHYILALRFKFKENHLFTFPKQLNQCKQKKNK